MLIKLQRVTTKMSRTTRRKEFDLHLVLKYEETSRKKPVHGLKVYFFDLPINELYEVFALASWSYKSDDNFPFKILPPN